MWVIKSHGVTFYVNHVTAEIPWSTKETPDNEKTKGSIKFKNCKLSIDEENCATLSKLGLLDRTLKPPRIVHARIITSYGGTFHTALNKGEFKHSKIKNIEGGCGTSFIICDLLDKNQVLMASLKYAQNFRIMSPNEPYYKKYEDKGDWIAEDYVYDEIDLYEE